MEGKERKGQGKGKREKRLRSKKRTWAGRVTFDEKRWKGGRSD